MLSSVVRPVTTAMLVAGAALVLTGCSAVQSLVGGVEPQRDEETGEIVAAAQADAFSLRVGDCLSTGAQLESEEVEDVQSVPTVPCDQEHDGEIYAAHQMTDEEYPGDDAVVAAADEFCYAEFEGFVGTAYEDSTLFFSTMFPSPDSWELGDDREILCVVVDEAGGVTGTLAGVGY